MKNVSNKVFLRSLRMIGACDEAVEWVKQHGGTTAELYRDCERGDWMNWIIVKMELVEKRELVGALADIAALSLKYYEKQYPDDKRVRECINTCKRYARVKATDKELNVAAQAAQAAYAAYAAYAAANAAAYAAYAAANAASAAAYAAYAAAYAAYAASAAASAAANAPANAAYAAQAAYAAYAAARMKTLKKCADIFRKHFPDLIEKGA